VADGQLSTAQHFAARLTQAHGKAPAAASRDAIDLLAKLPEPGNERWKYSPVNRLYEALGTTPLTPSSPADCAALLAVIDTQRYPLIAATALNLSSVTRLTLNHGDTLTPEAFDAQQQGCHWLHIDVTPGASAELLQRPARTTGLAAITSINIGAGSTLIHSVSGAPDSGTQWQLHNVVIGANGHYQRHQLSLGGTLERNDIHVQLTGRNAQAMLTGSLLSGARDRSDNQIVLEHQAADCRSTARFHGLANQHGKLTFGGRIHILPDAAGTDARLHNPNLLLADSAEINTKPELEIYNDDVACAHGATVGQLNDDAVFYLRSRGIELAAAKALLLRGFVEDGVGGPDQDHMITLINARFAQWTL